MTRPDPMSHPSWTARVRPGVVAAAIFIAAVVFVMFAGAGARVVECSVCHSMRPYAEAHAKTGHASLGCNRCHITPGLLGLPADGVRMVRWFSAEAFVDSVDPVRPGDTRCRLCHSDMLDQTVVSSVRVRHSDFEETSCDTCHAGVAHPLDGRWYLGPQMDDCLTCHRVILSNVGACDVCHPADATSAVRERPTAWRASHGVGWEQAHGMGDLAGCPACHAPSTCERCHGVGLPHPPTWAREHGAGLGDEVREACADCHQPEWCANCHGVDMPHPAGFLPAHGSQATEAGEAACVRCHAIEQCHICHFYSSHPNFPSVGMAAFGGGAGAR